MECKQVGELLPWLVNGSLAAEEADSIGRHLEECEGCRRELSETGAAFEIFAEHLPVATLIGLAFEGATDPVSRAVAERHLESCSSCLEQLALVRRSRQAMNAAEAEEIEAPRGSSVGGRSARVESFPAPGREPRPTPGRQVAIAASIVAVISTGGWLWTWQGGADPSAADGAEDRAHVPLRERVSSAAPEPDVPVVRAEPRESAPPGEEVVNRVPLGAGGVVLVLSSRLVGDAPLACRLEGADGVEIWSRQGLERRREGGFTLRLQTDRLDSGRYTLRLLTAGGAELESYLLSID